MYFFEHAAQPDAFSSIPAAMWWGIITLTTIGYGDVYPITTAGRVFGALIAVIGVGFVALPSAILVGGMMEQMELRRKSRSAGSTNDHDDDASVAESSGPPLCPHCGRYPDEKPSG
jgi:voltage-gated potassium channel